MAKNNQNKANSKSIKEQFKFNLDVEHFEADNHLEVADLEVAEIRLLPGPSPEADVLIVSYHKSPNLSFYDTLGSLIDVDHYLPQNYRNYDEIGADKVIRNLRNYPELPAKSTLDFKELLRDLYTVGDESLAVGLRKRYGLETGRYVESEFYSSYQIDSDKNLIGQLLDTFTSLHHLLESYIVFQQQKVQGYVFVTNKGNIILTPLNKRSGISVLIETQDLNGMLKPTHHWNIVRTNSPEELEQNLVFRSKDIQDYFDYSALDNVIYTDRYKLFQSHSSIAIDSLLDNTDNQLVLKTVNDCFQILHTDENIIVVLTKKKEVTLVNAHRSIIPQKWPKKISLPRDTSWIQVDENCNLLFGQDSEGEIWVYDIMGTNIEEIASLGTFSQGFQVDQLGRVIVRDQDSNALQAVVTNLRELILPSDRKGLDQIVASLALLFKSDSLFSANQIAEVAKEEKKETGSAMSTVIEQAKYDFETNVEHLIEAAGSDYNRLLEVRQKIAIARQNLGEELTFQAEKDGIFLVGQKLKLSLNSILGPSEKRIDKLIQILRARVIVEQSKLFLKKISEIADPTTFQDILNRVQSYEQEFDKITAPEAEISRKAFFKYRDQLNVSFSSQIASDGSALKDFLLGEIQLVEEAIGQTHEAQQLEILMSTHPVAIELFNLLKQPFVLQNIQKDKLLSPVGIQSRLFKAVVKRQAQLKEKAAKLKAEVNSAKQQLAIMIQENIDFFVKNHSGNFSDVSLQSNSAFQRLLRDFTRMENEFKDTRMALDLRKRLEKRILEKSREDLELVITFEGKYAFVKNDPDLFIDIDSTLEVFPTWALALVEKNDKDNCFAIHFKRNTDFQVYHPSVAEHLAADQAFEIDAKQYGEFRQAYDSYILGNALELSQAVWKIHKQEASDKDFPQYSSGELRLLLPPSIGAQKALRCAIEKLRLERQERDRDRKVPVISPDFIDETPYFQLKLNEFFIKAKLQLIGGGGVLLLTGPPSTGKSAFLKFAAWLMNREYFEHAADKWQTKNSLVTAIKFGDNGPYATPAGFTRAITTPNSMLNIEEIKEWPEALRKSLNPLLGGSKFFVAPDGTSYKMGDNILLCAAANLGAMYRQDDEPFTADFWSRVEVVNYDYAPLEVNNDYINQLMRPPTRDFLSMQDLARYHFNFSLAPKDPASKAEFIARQFLDFMLLSKTDEAVKRENINALLDEYFLGRTNAKDKMYGPEEATKVALRRLKDLQGYSSIEFFDLYNHFVNGQNLNFAKFSKLQTKDVDHYQQLRIQFLVLKHLEAALRHLRFKFYNSAGQTEIEGTNREFIKGVYLLGLLGKL